MASSSSSASASGPKRQNALLSKQPTDFLTYEDYLDTFVEDKDMYYLKDKETARRLVELGFRGKDILSRMEWRKRKEEVELSKMEAAVKNAPRRLAHVGKDLSSSPFLEALAQREELVLQGKLTTIIFIRDRNSKGQEISGFIDYYHRLTTEDFERYFSGAKLLPNPNDLSFFNWESLVVSSNDSPYLQVMASSEKGVVFKNKRDRKLIVPDPNLSNEDPDPGDKTANRCTRVEILTPEYVQVVLYDHMTRRKTTS